MRINVAVMDYLYALGGKSPLIKSSTKSILSQFVDLNLDFTRLYLPFVGTKRGNYLAKIVQEAISTG
jgi:hypothetical protein